VGRRGEGEGEGTCRAAVFECTSGAVRARTEGTHRGSDCCTTQLSTHRRPPPFSQFSSDTMF
jgi:hypothetical protein